MRRVISGSVTLSRLRRITTGGAVVMALLLLVVWGLGNVRSQAARPDALVPAPLAAGDPIDRATPPLRLIDDRGRQTSLASFRGKWLILAPSMTLCNEVCPMTTGVLMQVQSDLRRAGLAAQVAVAEVTVDPWRDKPARLRAYRRLTGADFDLLTGSQAQIRSVWKFFGVFYQRVAEGKPPDVDWLTHQPETMDVEHSDGLFLLDPAGDERVAVLGTPDVNGQLPAALHGLLDAQGRQDLAHPQLPWNAAQVIDDLYSLIGREVPAGAVPTVTAPSAAAAATHLAGSPAALAALHAEAGRLFSGSSALAAEVRRLRGYPVVVNAWASWCPPCRAEFPIFAATSVVYGHQVAFVGADADDTSGDATAFLAEHPVSYPSYALSSASLDSIAPIEGTPTTIFLDRAGHVVYEHPGEYDTQATLEADIDRYALGR